MDQNKPKKDSDSNGNEDGTIPFDEALRRLVNTPPKPKKSSAGGGGKKSKPSKRKAK